MVKGMRLPSGPIVQACLVACLSFIALLAQELGDPARVASEALRSRRFDDALVLLKPALERSPANKQTWVLQGLANLEEEKNKEALASFRAALKISPEYLPALEGAAQSSSILEAQVRFRSWNGYCG
jgi:tetratricopeptide (TPR) repeat protein